MESQIGSGHAMEPFQHVGSGSFPREHCSLEAASKETTLVHANLHSIARKAGSLNSGETDPRPKKLFPKKRKCFKWTFSTEAFLEEGPASKRSSIFSCRQFSLTISRLNRTTLNPGIRDPGAERTKTTIFWPMGLL